MSNEEAVRDGYTRNWITGDEVYQIVISDDYNREIWMTYPVEELGENNRNNLAAFMDKLGVRFDKGKNPLLRRYYLRSSLYSVPMRLGGDLRDRLYGGFKRAR